MKDPSLLDEVKYPLKPTDFPEYFHQLIFSVINNLYRKEGIETIDIIAIDNFLCNYDKQYMVFNDNNGLEYLENALENSSIGNFNYYYERVKKFSVLRDFHNQGIDVSFIYDDKEVIPRKQEEMQQRFDELSIEDVANEVEKKFIEVREGALGSTSQHGQQAGKGMKELRKKLKESPEFGSPFCSKIFTTLTRGARLKKFYMRSAPTGVGKTRISLADACNLAIPYIYDLEEKKWVKNGVAEPTLFITTELEFEEIQTMLWAFVSGVQEEDILENKTTPEEDARIDKAIEIIENSPLMLEHMPNFDIDSVERTIKGYIIRKNIKHVFFDYIHTSLEMLEEISKSSNGVKLREDNILLMFVTKLKEVCNKYGIFLHSATQVNGSWKTDENPDQNLLRGAKSMADKLDVGIIALEPSDKDLKALETIIHSHWGQKPNLVYHVYKNRRGKYGRAKIWLYMDLGNLRTTDLFITNGKYELLPLEIVDLETYLDNDDNFEDVADIEEFQEEENEKVVAHDF